MYGVHKPDCFVFYIFYTIAEEINLISSAKGSIAEEISLISSAKGSIAEEINFISSAILSLAEEICFISSATVLTRSPLDEHDLMADDTRNFSRRCSYYSRGYSKYNRGDKLRRRL